MAKQKTKRQTGSGTGHKAYWQLNWVKRVMCGEYSAFARLLFMRIASFGAAGCWMENVTLAAEFRVTERYIQMLLTELWLGGELWITNWNSSKRKIFAVKNPDVVAMAEERLKAEVKAGVVNDKADFYRKTKSRGFTAPNKRSGMTEETFGVDRRNVRG